MKKYINYAQISELKEQQKHKYPTYGKSTTDPTYYEPAATRIANMYKSSGLQLEGIYDYSKKSDVDKFSEKNYGNNIKSASVDPRFNSKLLPEEVSQISNDLGFDVEKTLNKKQNQAKDKNDRINEALETSQAIQKLSENNKTNE